MNLPILAAEIVRRVHKSQDSAINLEQVVSNLITEELDIGGVNATRSALKSLYLDTADYILVNRLGKIHHNQAMKGAAIVLGIPLDE